MTLNGCAMPSRWTERFGRVLLLSLWLNAAAFAESIKILVQSSPLAGSQYYGAKRLRGEIRVGDRLTLTREADNRHDRNAVRVDWNGQKLGYVPRAENRAVAQALDQVCIVLDRAGGEAEPGERGGHRGGHVGSVELFEAVVVGGELARRQRAVDDRRFQETGFAARRLRARLLPATARRRA